MYWVYLFLFILIVFTPEFVRQGFLFLGEENLESLLIFCFGMLGLLLYLGKESALLKTVKEKIFLQRETNQIRKDLAQSYSYIGEMNRRFDIIRNSLVTLPTLTLRSFSKRKMELYEPVFDALHLVTKSPRLLIIFVGIEKGNIIEKYDRGENFPEKLLNGKHFLEAKKFFWEETGFCLVRSPEDAFGTAAFLAFEKIANRFDNNETFQILAAEALFLYCVDHKRAREKAGEKKGG